MKTVFFVQDFFFNKKINYHDISQSVSMELQLIAYHITQEQLDRYVVENNYSTVFSRVIAFSKLEVDPIKEIIAKHTLSNGNNFLIVTNSESAVSVCGELRKYFGIDDDNLLRYTDKIEMKKKLSGKVSLPKYIKFSREQYKKNSSKYLQGVVKRLGATLFIKPTDQYSSIGTVFLENIEGFGRWYENNDSTFQFEIDEVITGTLYHCDSFIKNKKIIYTNVCEYLFPCHNFISGSPLGSITLPVNSADFMMLDKYNSYVLDHFGLPSGGMTHLEVFKKKDGTLVFLEIAARPAGAQVPTLYKKTLNVSIREAHLLLQIDPAYKLNIQFGSYGAWVVFPIKPGVVTSFERPKIKSRYTLSWNINVGDKLGCPNNISDAAGNILLWNDHYDELRDDFEYLKNFDAFHVI